MQLAGWIFFSFLIATAMSYLRKCQHVARGLGEKINLGYFPEDQWNKSFVDEPDLQQFFNFTLIDSNTSVCILGTVDLVTVPYVIDYYRRWGKINSKHVPLSIARPENGEIMHTWDEKKLWKDWMYDHGLESYVPKPVDEHHPTFPLILKSTGHFATGVDVVKSDKQLQQLLREYVQEGKNYLLEEPLTGMGLAEGALYGAAYDGELLAMRCIVRNHDPVTVKKQNFGENLFVRGNANFVKNSAKLWEGDLIPTNCGIDIAMGIEKMVRKGGYSGAFCVDFKMDNDKNIKFLEVNARTCYTLSYTKYLFISTYVPLAYAVEEKRMDLAVRKSGHLEQPQPWFINKKFTDIVRLEKAIAFTGADPTTAKKHLEYNMEAVYNEG